MNRVLVDMDGVLADVYTQFARFEVNKAGVSPDIESLSGKLELDAFPNGAESVRTIGFFRTAPLIQDSISGLKYLNDKYKVLIVSSATEFPQSLIEKVEWLREYFPFISWEQIVLCGKKDSIKGDVMIDDHPKNLNYFDGKKILFTQPHNVYVPSQDYTRVTNWKEIVNIL